jgi:hypothetical protein
MFHPRRGRRSAGQQEQRFKRAIQILLDRGAAPILADVAAGSLASSRIRPAGVFAGQSRERRGRESSTVVYAHMEQVRGQSGSEQAQRTAVGRRRGHGSLDTTQVRRLSSVLHGSRIVGFESKCYFAGWFSLPMSANRAWCRANRQTRRSGSRIGRIAVRSGSAHRRRALAYRLDSAKVRLLR